MKLSPALRIGIVILCVAAAAAGLSAVATAQAPGIDYYKLVPGFIAESKNEQGAATGTGFPGENPWGADTAYIMATNAKGQRTWRIENYLPQGATAQGSTMYLLEGSEKALLIDTAQNTKEEMGKNDLKTIVRHLLGHNNDGSVKNNPVDFVVAISHGHPDHVGKNGQMNDRTVYFPELDWPRNATANNIAMKEGGGAGAHGMAVGDIALGGRTLKIINLYGHTPGSVGFLDSENGMVFTSDAIGSGFVWAHLGMISQYAESVRHLKEVLRPLANPAILPGHFYQITSGARRLPPINGRQLDKQYVDDQLAAAEGVLNGTLVGTPYSAGAAGATASAKVGSAEMTYNPGNLTPQGTGGGVYRAIRISSQAIRSDFYTIREGSDTLYLVKGSAKALLVGTGSGAPGAEAFVSRLAGTTPVEVVVTSDDKGQVGGLSQFSSKKVYLPKGSSIPKGGLTNVAEVGRGDTIDLGGVTIQVEPLAGHSPTGLTLLDVSDRVLFGGDALGMQAADGGLILNSSLEGFAAALAAWSERTNGRYDVVMTSRNYQWQIAAAYVAQLQALVIRGLTEGAAAISDSAAMPGYKVIRTAPPAQQGGPGRGGSGGGPLAASIILPR
jgi:glyoxylase-like metal-dependent hydrolase (beta-lactamase superfamily II)